MCKWHTYSGEKKNEILKFQGKWILLGNIPSEVSPGPDRQMQHDCSHLQSLHLNSKTSMFVVSLEVRKLKKGQQRGDLREGDIEEHTEYESSWGMERLKQGQGMETGERRG